MTPGAPARELHVQAICIVYGSSPQGCRKALYLVVHREYHSTLGFQLRRSSSRSCIKADGQHNGYEHNQAQRCSRPSGTGHVHLIFYFSFPQQHNPSCPPRTCDPRARQTKRCDYTIMKIFFFSFGKHWLLNFA